MELTKVKPGERLSFTNYVEVLSKTGDALQVKDANGREFTIKGKQLIEATITSAAQYTTEKKVSRTEAVEALLGARDSVFTVVFDKKEGEERVLVGRLIANENHMGRSNVIDLEVTNGTNTRQVDHRTIKSLILRGVKYTVKK